MSIAEWIGYALAALAIAAIAYQLIALTAVRRFFAAAPEMLAPGTDAVTILKPLHGAEPRLLENLASFLEQDHAGPVQMVCGVSSADDPAADAVRDLQARFPEADIVLTTGPRAPGANAKIGNVTAMYPAARHDMLILSDSDMAVDRAYVSRLTASLARPGVGAVTCLYVGRGDAGVWSRISALAMSHTGLPNMVMALATSIAQPCLGSTIAMRRETLEAIGGFARFSDVLADDYAIGEAVGALGLDVTVPPFVLTHACAHRSFAELWHQHLRWSATIRGVAPMRHLGSGITHGLGFAVLAVPFVPLPGAILVGLALTVRLLTARTVGRIAGVRQRFSLLLPLADMLEFAAFIASFATSGIDWRGNRLTIAQKGRIAARNPSLTDAP